MTKLDNTRDKLMAEFENDMDTYFAEDGAVITVPCDLENPEICESCQ